MRRTGLVVDSSSTLVREIAAYGGDVREFLHPDVAEILMARAAGTA